MSIDVTVSRWDGDAAKGIDDALRAGVHLVETAAAPAKGAAREWRLLDAALLQLIDASDDKNSRDGTGLNRDDSRWARDRGNGIGNEESLSELLRRGEPIPPSARPSAMLVVRRYLRTQLEPAGFSWQALVAEERGASSASTPVIETAAELMRRDIPALRFIVEGLLPEGMVILAGRPKQGKSWLALLCALAVAQGARFLGRATVGGDVLYLAVEDGDRRLQSRIRYLWGPTAPERLHLATRWPRWHEGGREALEAWLSEHPGVSLIVIDTWGRVAPPPSTGRDTYSETTEILGPLQELAHARHACILIVHHTRKTPTGGEADLSDGILGTTALSGVADTLAVLKRQRGADAAILEAAGRDVPDTELALGWTERGWALLTTADTVGRDPVARAVVALAGAGPWEGTATDLLLALSTRAETTEASKGWPPTPNRLSERLGAIVPVLASMGIDVTSRRGTKGKRLISIRPVGDAGDVGLTHAEDKRNPTGTAGLSHFARYSDAGDAGDAIDEGDTPAAILEQPDAGTEEGYL